jgi:2-haloacid dehalogenase
VERERWATFDCYGTLIDWNSGVSSVLERLFGTAAAPALLARYHEVEPEVQREDPHASYRAVMAEVLLRLGASAGEEGALAESLPGWSAFPEVPSALERARADGWKLAILSNTDRDLIDSSIAQIGVSFELAIVASEIGSYKPAHGHWRAFEREVGRLPDVHVAASLFHDVATANELGIPSVWVNRLGESADSEPTREIRDLAALVGALGELVPA